MKASNLNLPRLNKISKKSYSTLPEKALKLSEEVGELAQVVLAKIGATNVSKSGQSDNIDKKILEETIDVIIVALDLVNSLNCPDFVFKDLINQKLSKWEAKL